MADKDDKRKGRRADNAIDIATSAPTNDELAFMAREFIMCSLPHSDPGSVPYWSRKNGHFTLGLEPGYDVENKCSFGLPYGPIPRLILAWMVTEAHRTRSPRLEVGKSLGEFMMRLGLSMYTGRGPRGDATRLMEQMRRFFNCVISFDYTDGRPRRFTLRMLPVEGQFHYWKASPEGDNVYLWGSFWIDLGQRFYQAITSDTVPLDLRVLRHIKHSPLALDLYLTLTREAFRAKKDGKDRFLSWVWLHQQLGNDYKRVGNFREKALPQVQAVIDLCPLLIIKVQRGGRGRRAGLVVSQWSEPTPLPTFRLPPSSASAE